MRFNEKIEMIAKGVVDKITYNKNSALNKANKTRKEINQKVISKISPVRKPISPYTVTLRKRWRAKGAEPCEFCASMDNVEAGIVEVGVNSRQLDKMLAALINHPRENLIADGYTDNTVPNAHPGCQCDYVWEIDKKSLLVAKEAYYAIEDKYQG